MRAALSVLRGLLLVAYPVLVYVGLTRFSARGVGLFLLAVLLPPHLPDLLRRDRREHVLAVLPLPAGIAAVLLLAAIVDDRRLVLALPVVVNAVLLASFGVSLRRGRTPFIERFARMQVDDLSGEEVAYCRTVTAIWCGFFVLNGSVTAVLAAAGPFSWWVAWTGGVAYALMGLLFTIEYVVRKARFGRYGSGLHDRILSFLLPPSRQGPPA